ncbi:hypothetical protein GUJ93_ZPchr0006g45194 [Zizania palustris]|uniref:Uncharacterized protein n=1 Tax=Zizania palustris TaxID=103762 RepID=A0A8J5W343_ZIZPA|nr:hypothetical protein GUJ93_ZPchr0006g45194 [Zizania palustris]
MGAVGEIPNKERTTRSAGALPYHQGGPGAPANRSRQPRTQGKRQAGVRASDETATPTSRHRHWIPSQLNAPHVMYRHIYRCVVVVVYAKDI